MRICIISDLHCKLKLEEGEKAETFLFSNIPRRPANHHPVVALLNLLERDDLSADYLVCPGDLCDKADEQGITSAWAFLQEINSKLQSKLLIGIPGNHDINSRKKDQKEPFDFIKNFHEKYPVEDDGLKALFWEKGFCFLQDGESVFLLINSVKDHSDSEKAKQSDIKPEILDDIEQVFNSSPALKAAKFKIAVLHHHPLHHSDIKNWKETDMVNNGDKLLQLLNRLRFQIVIHGHKHQPRLVEVDSLPVFACGSFASFANLQGTGINTMFHIVDLSENSRKGNIYSWEFDFINGWCQKLNDRFPPKVGFGGMKTVEEIAESIDRIFSNNGRTPMFFDNILEQEQDIKFTLPENLRTLKEVLLDRYKIKTVPEFPIEPSKIYSQL